MFRFFPYLILSLLLLLALVAGLLPETDWLGHDRMGGDLLVQLAFGARTSLGVGVGATVLATAIGLVLGTVAGMDEGQPLYMPRWGVVGLPLAVIGGWFYGFRVWGGLPPEMQPYWFYKLLIVSVLCVGLVAVARLMGKLFPVLKQVVRFPASVLITGFSAVVDALPPLLLVLALSAIFPSGWGSTLLIIGLTGWMGLARMVQVTMRQTLTMPYVEAARVSGVPGWRIAVRHVWPAIGSTLRALLPLAVGGAIMAEGALSFLGEGVGNEHISWGGMLATARGYSSEWQMALWPGLAIFLTVLACNQLAHQAESHP